MVFLSHCICHIVDWICVQRTSCTIDHLTTTLWGDLMCTSNNQPLKSNLHFYSRVWLGAHLRSSENTASTKIPATLEGRNVKTVERVRWWCHRPEVRHSSASALSATRHHSARSPSQTILVQTRHAEMAARVASRVCQITHVLVLWAGKVRIYIV